MGGKEKVINIGQGIPELWQTGVNADTMGQMFSCVAIVFRWAINKKSPTDN